MNKCIAFFFFMLLSMNISAQLQSPDEFLPHKLGEHFSPHHMLIEYFKHVDSESPLVEVSQYGTTNEDRPLITAFISSEKNLAQLETIRKNHMSHNGKETVEKALDRDIAVVWLSFSVHGNESAGTESSYKVLYDLANPSNTKTKEWLENTIVILDPCINPDGYSRYVDWVRRSAGVIFNPSMDDIEHNEPWPGGRTNHYFFDLNRDWAWQTQKESKQRLKLYNQWMPHVHADLHEMGHNSPYYFAPAAEPYHDYITDWQREFQVTIGKNHAKYFDAEGWLYFTKEVFDLLYPSYGDTYPIFNGAIGMTYEQGGSGRGGRAVETQTGEVLTLKDRIAHHATTALSTVEASSVNADKLVVNYKNFFTQKSSLKKGQYQSYVIKKDISGNKLKELRELLDNNGIEYGTTNAMAKASGFSYGTRSNTNFEIHPGDLIINTNQTKTTFVQVLFDPVTTLVDSLTYDITAWSLPYAYGLDAYALNKEVSSSAYQVEFETGDTEIEDAYAYALRWTDFSSVQALARIAKAGLKTRVANAAFSSGGNSFEPGTIIINKADNKTSEPNLANKLTTILAGSGAELIPLKTGFSVSGPDLGSSKMRYTKNPKVLAVMGEGVNSNAFGQLRFYFEQEIQYPITVVELSDLFSRELSKYNVLVLPDGRYRFSDGEIESLGEWVSDGGKLIAMSGALRALADKPGFSLAKYATDDEKSEDEKETKAATLQARHNHYEGSERRYISNIIPGAIFKLEMDATNPLAYGLGKHYHSLKTSNLHYPLMKNAWNVGKVNSDPVTIGFVGAKIKEKLKNTMTFGVQEKGRGSIIYLADNPLYRGFWRNGLHLFGNALFIAGI